MPIKWRTPVAFGSHRIRVGQLPRSKGWRFEVLSDDGEVLEGGGPYTDARAAKTAGQAASRRLKEQDQDKGRAA